MEIVIAIVGVVALIVGIILYSSLSWGYVAYKMWSWFILPVFTQAPTITFWQAVGIMFFIGLFHNHTTADVYISDKWEYKDKNSAMVNALIAPWVTILVAYMIKTMFM